jgi:hypothetical protein
MIYEIIPNAPHSDTNHAKLMQGPNGDGVIGYVGKTTLNRVENQG